MLQKSSISYCKKDVMSICTADSRKNQEECRYYEKARQAERCMYFVFDEYCDCLNAQLNA